MNYSLCEKRYEIKKYIINSSTLVCKQLFQTPKLGESFTYSVNGPTNVLPEKMGRLYPMYIVKHGQKFTGVSGAALFFWRKIARLPQKYLFGHKYM